ncbi:MAG: hypothetical protein M3Z66_04740 [Chloroflexota bacterium]|nr:hypothetical protein [Chloroflexota bacterium]
MSNGEPVQSVDASTVILVRHGQPVGTPWQCFMVRRHVRSEFASDVYVFPGGKVDAADAALEMLARVDSEPHPLEHGEPQDRWLALKVAAIRELFEEAGVLLARDSDGNPLRVDELSAEHLARWRKRLQADGVSFLDMLREEDLRLAAGRLHPFSHWITPTALPRRYNTLFWVAYLPDGQTPLHDEHETTAGIWIAPKEALERSRQGDFPLVFATVKHLERMARYPSIEQMIAETSEADLEPITPKLIHEHGEARLLLPGEVGYQD